MINYSIPFYPNTSDDTHCFQAGIKMIYEYFKPDDVRSFGEWDKISEKVENMWTWPMAALIWMSTDFDIIVVETFDYERFANEGGHYLEEFFGKGVAKKQIEMSDISQEQIFAREFPTKINLEKRTPTIEDITRFLDQGYLVACAVNVRIFSNREGYAGHFVVVKGYADDNLILNDPGLPEHENWSISKDLFLKAWAYPNDEALNLTAFQLKEEK